MWNIRTSVPEDIPAQRQLWKLAFGDEDAYIDNFYNIYYRPERVIVLEEGGCRDITKADKALLCL